MIHQIVTAVLTLAVLLQAILLGSLAVAVRHLAAAHDDMAEATVDSVVAHREAVGALSAIASSALRLAAGRPVAGSPRDEP